MSILSRDVKDSAALFAVNNFLAGLRIFHRRGGQFHELRRLGMGPDRRRRYDDHAPGARFLLRRAAIPGSRPHRRRDQRLSDQALESQPHTFGRGNGVANDFRSVEALVPGIGAGDEETIDGVVGAMGKGSL